MKALKNFGQADSFAWEFWVYFFSGDWEHFDYNLVAMTYRYDKSVYWILNARPRYNQLRV
jgi:hypothetical protein